MILIGITGPAGSGKSTAAQYLADQYSLHNMAFADPIREMFAAMLGMSLELLEATHLSDRYAKERTIPHIGASPRRLMQTLGTEWGRDTIHPDIWVRLARERLGWVEDHTTLQGAVISDVRFDNEATMIRAAGGLIIHMHRDDHVPVEAHRSEHGVSYYEGDALQSNNATRQRLYADLDRLMALTLDREVLP